MKGLYFSCNELKYIFDRRHDMSLSFEYILPCMKYSLLDYRSTFSAVQGLQQMNFKIRRKNIFWAKLSRLAKKGLFTLVTVQPDPSVPVLHTMLCTQMKTDTFEVLSIMFTIIPLPLLRLLRWNKWSYDFGRCFTKNHQKLSSCKRKSL